MRIAFFIIVFLHACIHLLGFVKGFGLNDVKALTMPINKTMGTYWLIAAILLIIYLIFYAFNYKYSWILGMLAIVISQFLIILFWKDAKFGTIPNIIILLVALSSFGHNSFDMLVQKEISQILDNSNILSGKTVTMEAADSLPSPVKKWLLNSGIIGKPFISVGKVTQKAQLKMKPNQDQWLNAKAIQFSNMETPAFIWTVDVKMNQLLQFIGRDKFENGKGAMLIKLNALINIVNQTGPKLDEGSLQRYLGEMVWFPSLALSPYITWQEVNDSTALATLNYEGTTGSGTFHFDENGDFIKFSTLRYMENIPNAKRYEWVLEVGEYSEFEGIKTPSKMTATWKLDKKDWTWLLLEITDISYNEKVFKHLTII